MMKTRVIPNNPGLEGLLDLKAQIPFAYPEGEELCLQLVKPQWFSGGAGFPLVVFIQGSGWTKPNQFWEIPQLCRLAERGYVIASVTHRHGRTSPAPAFLQDVKTAIRFLRAHAAEYDIDKTRVAAWGTSSGGNTALLLGLTGDNPDFEGPEWPGESSAVSVVVDCFGPTDMVKMSEVQYNGPHTAENIFFTLGGCDEDKYLERLRKISPIEYVKPGLKLPPFLLLHGDADPVVLYEDTEAFCGALERCGYEVELVKVTGAPHEGSFWSPQLLEIIFDFICEKL